MSDNPPQELTASSQQPPVQPPIQIGDIFMVDWSPGRGSEETGERPAVVVQNNAFNANPKYPNTIAVTVSKHGRRIPTHVEIPKSTENGLREPISYAKCEQLFTIDKARLGRKVGKVTPEQLDGISRALKRVMSLV
jgi:mRNA interferase MazF